MSASAAAQNEWHQRIEAEYRSAALTAQLTHWLIQAGAAPDLIEIGLGIVTDELAHAELSHAVYRRAGGTAPPAISRPTLELGRDRDAPLERAIARYGVELFCLGETVAVRLFQRMRAGCDVDVARQALDRIVKDEVTHRDFGWALLEWLLKERGEPELVRQLRGELPAMLERVRRSYGGAALDLVGRARLEAEARDFPAADRAWGLIPLSSYVEAFEQTLARDYRPRLLAFGIELPPESNGVAS